MPTLVRAKVGDELSSEFLKRRREHVTPHIISDIVAFELLYNNIAHAPVLVIQTK